MIGFKIRTGGTLPEKIFGVFSLTDPDAEDEEQASAEHKQAEAWAKKHTDEAKLLDKPFTFVAYVPSCSEEEKGLLTRYYETIREAKTLYA